MKQVIQHQRFLLLKRLDELSNELKIEVDSLRADAALEEMRNIGKLLQELVSKPVAGHPFTHSADFKEHGKAGYQAKLAKIAK